MQTIISDDYETPASATRLLLPYLDPKWTVWEPAAGRGMMVTALFDRVNVVSTDVNDDPPFDFLTKKCNFHFDCIVTNPPNSKIDEFLSRSYRYGKPFALLMPLTALEGKKRSELYSEHGISLLIPRLGVYLIDVYAGSPYWCPMAWFTWKLLDKDLIFKS